ncbi:hypothetical protein [Streptomyces spiramenti]|uniref:hypothetical protein n=1 Tax=Streptomyces spiramenti TaxID=2720606 RepID=UPI003B83A4CF
MPTRTGIDGTRPPAEARAATHGTLSTALALRSDRQLGELVADAPPLGGTSALLEVEGVPVFVKRVPLTDLERLPEHVRSTANLFGLPGFCQYGVGGSPGSGRGGSSRSTP